MRVYHFINERHGLDNLLHRRLKIATIEDLNDPFEMSSIALDTLERREAWGRFKLKLTLSYGLLCFSREWQNPVQWSHYADRHRGLCLGFDVPETLPLNVEYRATRHKPELLDNFNEDVAKKILTTKYRHWSYEQEVRIFSRLEDRDQETGLYFKEFDRDLALREVIVGHRSMLTRQAVAFALGELAATVTAFRARLAFKSYRVVKQRDQKLWV
jgi:hypothetical protein